MRAFPIVSTKGTRFSNNILVSIIVLIYVHGSRHRLRIYAASVRCIWVKICCELFMWSMFVDHGICTQSFLRRGRCILIKSWYQLFIWAMFIDHPIHSKSLDTKGGKFSNKLFVRTIHWLGGLRSSNVAGYFEQDWISEWTLILVCDIHW